MSGHTASSKNAHDHDLNMEGLLYRLGRSDAQLPEQWSGTLHDFANLLNVSVSELNDAWACQACSNNYGSGQWNDRIAWGSYNRQDAPAKAPRERRVEIRELRADGSVFVHYGPGHGVREELSSRGARLPEGFRGNGLQLAQKLGRSVDDLSTQFGESTTPFADRLFDVGKADVVQ